MDFKNFSDGELVAKLKGLVTEERKITTEILHFLREVEARRLYAIWGYPSLFEFCTKELGYSAGAAQRRIESMRLLKSLGSEAVKQIEENIQDGKINLTQLSLLQTFVRNKEKKENQKIKPEEKLTWLNQMASRPTRECEKILRAMDLEIPLFSKEKVRVISENRTELKFGISDALLKKLERIRELRAHVNPKMTYEEMLEYLAEVALEKIAPERKIIRLKQKNAEKQKETSQEKSSVELPGSLQEKNVSKQQGRVQEKKNSKQFMGYSGSKTKRVNLLPALEVKSKPQIARKRSLENAAVGHPQSTTKTASHLSSWVSNNRAIPAHIKRKVWLRDRGCCTYWSAETGRVCGSRYGLEFEHIHPFALGRVHTESNITLHCKAHNRVQAVAQFGDHKMKLYFEGKVTFQD